MGKFFKNKVCIYLDQFAVSGIADGTDWKDFSLLLNLGIDKEKLCVLYSVEHVLESCQRDYDRALVADRLLFKMSQGVSLKGEPEIVAQLLINAIRRRSITHTTYSHVKTQNDFENRKIFEALKSKRAIFNQMVKEGTAGLNQIRDATRKGAKVVDHRPYVSVLVAKYQRDLEVRLKKYWRYGFYNEQPVIFSMHTIPFWADEIMNILVHKHQITRQEAKKGEDLLKKQGTKKIVPVIYVRSCLEAILGVKHQKETANDHLDIMRLGSAVPFADILLIDKSKAYDIKLLGLNNHFNTEVYSGTPTDLQNFMNRIEELIQ